MSFYLLKSTTRDRDEIGDVIIDKTKLIAINIIYNKKNDYFKISCESLSGENWIACFETKEEARTVVKELTGVSDELLDDHIWLGKK